MTDKHPMDVAFNQWWNGIENFATRAERLDGESPESIAKAAFFAALAASKPEPQACQDYELLRLAREARQRMESRKDEDVAQWAEKLVASVGEPQAQATNEHPLAKQIREAQAYLAALPDGGKSVQLQGTDRYANEHTEHSELAELLARCREILDWHNTGILKGNALREYALKKYGDNHDALQCAENDTAREAYAALLAADKAVDMVLYCPKCGTQHIDAIEPAEFEAWEPEGVTQVTEGWDNPPHKSHLCHGCGHIWRPSDTPTNGVERTASGKDADNVPLLATDKISVEVVAKIRKWAYGWAAIPYEDPWKYAAEEIIRLLDAIPRPQPVPDDVVKDAEFEVWQNDEMVCSASGPREMALRETRHYVAQYAQDGPVQVFEVRRIAIDAAMIKEGK